MKVKTCPVKVKAGADDGTDEDQGVFEAIVATYSVDSVGDRLTKGAFKDTLDAWKESGDPIPVLWSHMHEDPESHIGWVEEAEEREQGLWVRARLDIEEPKAAKVYKLLKGKRVRNFSFAYDIEDGAWVEGKNDNSDEGHYELRKVRLYEIGPTLIGANQETALTSVKSALGSHSSATDDSAWDGPANEARLPTDAGVATYRKAYAWVDPDGDPDTKSAYKFIHHNISEDGAVGAANVNACTTGIAVLNGGRGGSAIPDSDRQGVYNHLAKHLTDADMELPELKSRGEIVDTDDTADEKDDAGSSPMAVNGDALRDALDKIAEGVQAMRSALPSTSDGEDDEKQASPARPAAAEEPTGAKTDQPARPGTASIRLHTDLAALAAEVEALTS